MYLVRVIVGASFFPVGSQSGDELLPIYQAFAVTIEEIGNSSHFQTGSLEFYEFEIIKQYLYDSDKNDKMAQNESCSSLRVAMTPFSSAQNFSATARVRNNVTDSTFLTGYIIIKRFMFFQLYSNNFRLAAGWLSLSKLIVHFSKPIEQIVDIANHLQRSLFAQLNSFCLSLDLFGNCIKSPIIPGYETFDCRSTFSRRHLTKLRADSVDLVQDGSIFRYLHLESDNFFLTRFGGLQSSLRALHPIHQTIVIIMELLHQW
ncbi:hypothetical protein ALC56_09687 [Trachymyrmex septentrionalis]|uniref:Uncharacterized protein n=1 Tax=Trachymyrmex septentrionalis TaxID=34720 RepID=A0A195F685_9HYME|nr:hypothetical protein ALC56_09687 [Trachymyrmex septentrionalis]